MRKDEGRVISLMKFRTREVEEECKEAAQLCVRPFLTLETILS